MIDVGYYLFSLSSGGNILAFIDIPVLVIVFVPWDFTSRTNVETAVSAWKDERFEL